MMCDGTAIWDRFSTNHYKQHAEKIMFQALHSTDWIEELLIHLCLGFNTSD